MPVQLKQADSGNGLLYTYLCNSKLKEEVNNYYRLVSTCTTRLKRRSMQAYQLKHLGALVAFIAVVRRISPV